jgi:hypothetical protein
VTAGRDIAFGPFGTNFNNDVLASGSLTLNAGRDVIVDGFADLGSDSFFQGTGGDVIVNAGRDINVLNVAGTSASIAASGSAGANVVLTTGAGGTLNLSRAVDRRRSSSNSGNVTVNADRILIDAGSGMSTFAGRVTLLPTTDGRSINLGSAGDAALAVELSDAELDRIFTPSLFLGGPDTGTVTVSANISPLGAPDVTIQSGTDIVVNAGGHRAGHRRAAVAGSRRYRAGRRLRPGGRGRHHRPRRLR